MMIMKRKIIYLMLMMFLLVGCDKKMDSNKTMTMIINNNTYVVELVDNNTVNELINHLPLELQMNELNGNEKYVYLDFELKTNSYKPNHINKGDVMLFGSNCLVLFYKSFDTSYSYTKIGHISNLEDLNKDNIKVIIK